MPNTRIRLNEDLRALLRMTRTDVQKLTQKGAALASGLSESGWRAIETGQLELVLADTAARMYYALDVTPEQLRAIEGWEARKIADLVERRLAILEPEMVTSDMERHLMVTPGLSDDQRRVLIYVANGMVNESDENSGLG